METPEILQAILKAAPAAIIRMDRTGKILDYLGKAEQYFQYTADEIVSKNFVVLMSETDQQPSRQLVEQCLNTDEQDPTSRGQRLQARRKNGSLFPVEVKLSRIGAGEALECIGFIRDISSRVADELHIESIRANLAAANQQNALNELSILLADEINKPLTAATNYLDALDLGLAQQTASNTSELEKLTQKASEQTRAAGEIVRRLRRMLVPPTSDPKLFDLHETVARAMAALTLSLGGADVDIAIEHKGEPRVVAFDHLQLHQVLATLVSNALIALEDAQTKRLTITSEVRETEFELRVTDTGPGVPEGRKSAIFDSLVSDSLSGLGLGLAIAKRIATAHSGEIWVEDGPDGGAVFRMVIPLPQRGGVHGL